MACLLPLPSSNAGGGGRRSHADFPSSLKLLLINAKSIKNKLFGLHNLIMDEEIDLARITETWATDMEDVNAQSLCPWFLVCDSRN